MLKRDRMKAMFAAADKLAAAPEVYSDGWYEWGAKPTPMQRACRVVDEVEKDVARLSLEAKTSLMFLVEAQINAALAATK